MTMARPGSGPSEKGPRRRSNAATRLDSEQRYRSLFENMHEGLAYCEMLYVDGRPDDFMYLDVNAAFETQTGLKNVVGKLVSKVIPGIRESDPELLEVYGRVAAGGPSEQFEMHVAAMQMWFSISAYCPEAGKFIAVFDVITERVLTERRLRSSNALLERTEAISQTGSWRQSIGTGAVTWSAEMFRIFGMDPEARALGLAELMRGSIHPEDRAAVEAANEVALHGGTLGTIEYRIICGDGSIRWVRGGGEREYDETGRLVALVGYVQDITELEQAEAARAENERRLRAIFDLVPVGISVLEPDGTLSEVSPALRRILHLPEGPSLAGAVTERRYVRIDGTTMPPEEFASTRARAEGGPVIDVETGVEMEDGGVVWVSVSAAPLSDSSGRVVVVTVDATERKRLQAQLAQSQKMEAVGRLAGGIAHDFNNLLTAIGGFARVLEADLEAGTADPDDAREIRQAADRAAGLTAKLLAFSGPRAGQMTSVRLDECVAQILPMLRRIVPERIEIETKLLPGPSLQADPTELDQVIVNLVVNAADSMPGVGRITVETTAVHHDVRFVRSHLNSKPGRHVRLSVSDVGSGIDATVRAHIFEPFYTTKPSGHGTGLGLATVYGVVERMGGTIEVTSAPGAGTTFELDFPASAPATAFVLAASADLPNGGNERVLLVEDDPAVRQFASKALERLGYRLMAVENPVVAMAVPSSDYDMLITDVVMPGMDGSQLVRTLRIGRPDLPVLFVSGYSQATAGSLALDEPRTALLSKPFTQAELASAARKVLDETTGP
jgi:two-component system cell cycle sensor histidine kinase/response regulator CckA